MGWAKELRMETRSDTKCDLMARPRRGIKLPRGRRSPRGFTSTSRRYATNQLAKNTTVDAKNAVFNGRSPIHRNTNGADMMPSVWNDRMRAVRLAMVASSAWECCATYTWACAR